MGGPLSEGDDISTGNGGSRVQRIADNVVTTVTARYSSVLNALLLSFVIVPGGTYGIVRIVNATDRTAERQEELTREVIELKSRMTNVASDQVQGLKNLSDRMTVGETTLNNRITEQGNFMRQLQAKVDELFKAFYTQGRGR